MPVKIWANVVNQIEFTSKLSWNDALQAGVSATPDKWTSSSNTIGRWMRPDLYWTPNWWSGNRLFTDNEAGSMATLRATFCIQTLSMPDPRMFNAFCKGAVLYSVFETSEAVEARAKAGSSVTLGADGTMAKVQGLSLVYDDWFRAYEMNEQKHLPKNKNYFQSQRVCALYDHFRANEVFFLTKPQRDIELINEARNRK